MGIFGTLRKAFGFGADDDDDPGNISESNDYNPDSTPVVSSTDSALTGTDQLNDKTDATGEGQVNGSISTDTRYDNEEVGKELSGEAVNSLLSDKSLPADLFDGIISVFNSALPDFVSKCINPDSQRKKLLEELDSRLRNRLAKEIADARRKGRKAMAAERVKVQEELTKAKELNKILNERQQNTNAARLSAERQKRALTDRVHDLENQVAALEADKEQYALERLSLLNRIRAASVEAEETPEKPAESKPENSHDSEMLAEIETLKENNIILNEALEQHKAQKKISDDLIHTMQSAAAKSSTEVEELRTRVQKLTDASEELENMRRLLAENDETARQKDEQILELNETIRANLYNYSLESARMSRQISKLQNRITELSNPAYVSVAEPLINQEDNNASDENTDEAEQKSSVTSVTFSSDDSVSESTEEPVEEKPKQKSKRGRPRKDTPKISAIDELMEEGNDWFGATADAPHPSVGKKTSHTDNDDFGYKTPPRKEVPDNQDQLSLW